MRPFLFIVLVLLLAGVVYVIYMKWFHSDDTTNWSFIPENAALVYESGNALYAYEYFRNTTIGATLEKTGGIEKISSGISALNDMTGGRFEQLVNGNDLLVSVHDISRNEFDFLYVLKVGNMDDFRQLDTIQAHFEKRNALKKNRTYQDFTITELSLDEKTFAFIVYQNFWVGSFSAFLVEDAIRTFSEQERPSFEDSFPALQTLVKRTEDQGDLYINIEAAQRVFQNFADVENINVGYSGFLDVAINEGFIEMSGFTLVEKTKNSILNPNRNIVAGAFDIGKVIPLQSACVLHYTFEDAEQWGRQYQQHLMQTDEDAVAAGKALLNAGDFDINSVYRFLDEEVALVYIEEMAGTHTAMILEVSNPAEATRFFDEVAARFGRVKGDTLYNEFFNDTELKLLPANDFPKVLMGEAAAGFTNSYYCTVGNCIIVADALYTLKDILRSIEEESTWFKSLKKNEFLERTNQAANFSVFIHTPDIWPKLTDKLSTYWQSFFEENKRFLRSVNNIALQFSQVDGRFFTNLVLSQSRQPVLNRQAEELASVSFPEKIISKPYILKTQGGGGLEILVQDSSLTARLLNKAFSTVWSVPIFGAVSGEIFAIDFYGSGNRQYAFTTDSLLYVINNRTGDFVPGYPSSLANVTDLRNFNVIDYDGSKRYRFSFSDGKGNLYLTDKHMGLLEGWNPKKMEKSLSEPLRHKRIGNRDIMIVVLSVGEVHIFNRRGELLPRFPLKLSGSVSANYHFKEGKGFEDTYMTVLTDVGEIISFNINGEVVKREQLYKNAPDSHFGLIQERGGNQFILTTWDDRQWSVLDSEGLELFKKEYLTDSRIGQQFYTVSAGRELVVLRSETSEKLYPFNLEGSFLTDQPIDNSNPVSVIYNTETDAFHLYNTYANTLQLLELKIGE